MSLARRAAFLLLLCGCGGPTEVAIDFEGLVGGLPARCGVTYSGIGTTASDLELADFRLYVHDVRLVTPDGREVPLRLEEDGVWQRDGVALLDFEDGGAACESGTPETNASLRGTADEAGPFTGLRFVLGVPFALNHADASTAAAPLNRVSMFWSWNAGYKFLRVDARTRGQPAGWRLHVGSTGCEGDGRGNVTGCAHENRAEIALDGFDPTVTGVTVDLADLLRESDVDADLGGAPGCMSEVDDPECSPLFHGLGLPFDGAPPAGAQRAFRPAE